MASKKQKKYYWNYKEEVTLEEFIKRVAPMIRGPVNNLWEMEGDMFMSDFSKLSEAASRLHQLANEIEKGE